MLPNRAQACRLAARLTVPPTPRNFIHKAALSTSPRTSRYLSTYARPRLSNPKYSIQRIQTITQYIRHCSHHRAMCRNSAENVGGSMDVSKGREVLPTNVKPMHYDLTLEPDFEKFTYEGTVVIEYVP